MDKPLRPETLPGTARPGGAFPNRPDIGGRPDGGRFPNRPGGGNDRIHIGNNNIGNNTVINRRPTWVNINNNTINNINNRWQGQINGMRNWGQRYPNRVGYWNNWGSNVRNRWGSYYRHAGWFGPNWWPNHRHAWCGWNYGYRFNNFAWTYWWTVPTFAACANWFNWSAPAAVWSQPVYYDYGQGGNVVYSNNNVYINGEQVATADEFAQSAAELATVAPPANEQQAAQAEWMPLGTFGVSSNQSDVEPTRVIQLAVSKEGIVSGTLYNIKTDQTQSVQGQVDKQTQRVAFRIGESENIVVETGLYNLTQDNAPALVHFGQEKVEEWLLVRLEQPPADGQNANPQ